MDTGVAGFSDSSFGVFGQSETKHGVFGEALGSGSGVRAESSSGSAVSGFSGPSGTGHAAPAATGVYGESATGRGGVFRGNKAQVQLRASTATTHPPSGARGDLIVGKSGHLWFCRGGSSWKQLA